MALPWPVGFCVTAKLDRPNPVHLAGPNLVLIFYINGLCWGEKMTYISKWYILAWPSPFLCDNLNPGSYWKHSSRERAHSSHSNFKNNLARTCTIPRARSTRICTVWPIKIKNKDKEGLLTFSSNSTGHSSGGEVVPHAFRQTIFEEIVLLLKYIKVLL